MQVSPATRHLAAHPNRFWHAAAALLSFEAAFVAFLFAGQYKGDPRLAWVPVDLTALFLGIGAATGITLVVLRKVRIRRSSVHIGLACVALPIWAFVSLLWTPGELYAREKATGLALIAWSVLATSVVIASASERVSRFQLLLIPLATWISFEVAVAYIAGGGARILSIAGGNYLGAGRVVGAGAVVVVGQLILGRGHWTKRAIGSIAFVGSALAMLLLGGRGPLLSLIGACGTLVFLFIRQQRGGQRARSIAALAIVFVVLGSAIAYAAKEAEATWTISRLMLLTEADMGASAESRLGYYTSAFSLWGQNPILGLGIGGYPVAIGLGDTRGYPHNIVLEILLELGLVGISLFALAAVIVISRLRKAVRLHGPNSATAIALCVFAFLNAQVSGDLADNRFLFAFAGLSALYVTSRSSSEASQRGYPVAPTSSVPFHSAIRPPY